MMVGSWFGPHKPGVSIPIAHRDDRDLRGRDGPRLRRHDALHPARRPAAAEDDRRALRLQPCRGPEAVRASSTFSAARSGGLRSRPVGRLELSSGFGIAAAEHQGHAPAQVVAAPAGGVFVASVNLAIAPLRSPLRVRASPQSSIGSAKCGVIRCASANLVMALSTSPCRAGPDPRSVLAIGMVGVSRTASANHRSAAAQSCARAATHAARVHARNAVLRRRRQQRLGLRQPADMRESWGHRRGDPWDAAGIGERVLAAPVPR